MNPTRPRTVMLDRDSLGEGLDFNALESIADVTYHDETRRDQAAGRIADAEVVISNKVMLDAETIAGARALKLICVAATGTNNVDLTAASARAIPVCNVTAYGTASVAQHVLGLILALATRLLDYNRAVRAGRWNTARQFCLLDYPILELEGRTLGIVGHGELGGGVARRAEALGMRVLLAARPGGRQVQSGRIPLDELLPQVDVLSLHCPLNEHTRNLIGTRELRLMKPTALLINAARGGIVDEQALADALRGGIIGGAGVDVLTEEPPKNGNPLLAEDIPNLIVTPHCAWASHEARQRVLDQVGRNIERFLAGQPRNQVNP